jgi:hypothetical protein
MPGNGDILVVGIGNPDRGDDAVGRLALREIAARGRAGCRLVERDGDAAGLVELLSAAGTVIIVDAGDSERRREVFAASTPSANRSRCALPGRAMGLGWRKRSNSRGPWAACPGAAPFI